MVRFFILHTMKCFTVNLLYLVSALAIMAGFAACSRASHTSVTDAQGDTLTHYASALTMVEYPEYVVAEVAVPWHDGALARYAVPKTAGAKLPEGFTAIIPDDGGIVSFSSVYSNALVEFGAIDRLQAVADPAYLPLGDTVRALVAAGRVQDAGSSMAPLLEKIIDAEPSLVFASPYETGGAVAAMQRAGLPLVLMADYVETDPRGRAEWMRLIGLVTGHRQVADSLASQSIDRYNRLAQLVTTTNDRPKVITEKPMQGVWYVPGGRSYVAHLIADAGGEYVWVEDSAVASVPMSLENVLERGGDAPVWLIKDADEIDVKSLTAQVPQARAFKAMPDGVWTCNTMTTPYFDDIALHPDRVLEDYIVIFHPSLAGDSLSLRYYSKIK